MTEAEWLEFTSEDGLRADEESLKRQLYTALKHLKQPRELRLFACACCRRIWDHLPSVERRVVEVAEHYADGLATARETEEAVAALHAVREARPDPEWQATDGAERHARGVAVDAFEAVLHAEMMYGSHDPELKAAIAADWAANAACEWAQSLISRAAELGEYDATAYAAREDEVRAQWRLLADIFGNPFRPVTFDSAWRTTDVLLLARGTYEERAFDRMPILADALQEAGCDSEEILNHCRGEGPHARGYWVLDQILGNR